LSWLEFDGLRKSISPVLLYDEPLSTIKDFWTLRSLFVWGLISSIFTVQL
jgi:hypothetical protein